MSLKNLDEFNSFDEFEKKLISYSNENHVNYYISGSKSNKDPDILWSYKTYKCVHAENPETFATTSKGTRPNQKIHNKNHPWTIRCTYSLKKKIL